MEKLNIVEELYRYFRDERSKHSREPGVHWVTDLVSCSLKVRYEQLYPELSMPDVFNPVLIQGVLIHKGLGLLLAQLFEAKGAKVEVEKEACVEVDLTAAGLAGGKALVKGRADIIVSLPSGEGIGIEVKTARSDIQLPLEHHVDQVRAYNTIFDLSASYLLYVTPERITQFEVEERMSMEELALRATEHKAPRYTWECRYCNFAVLCPYKVTK
ncbi:MAG: hypothetical protein QW407_06025 [Thermofilaceae archaeon]